MITGRKRPATIRSKFLTNKHIARTIILETARRHFVERLSSASEELYPLPSVCVHTFAYIGT